MKLVITGNIGSGKSSIAKLLHKMAAPDYVLVSVDEMVKDLYQDDAFVLKLLTRFGTCEKNEISQIVFKDKDALAFIEEASMAFLSDAIDDALLQPNIIMEFPLYFEWPIAQSRFDKVLLVDVPREVRWERVNVRDGKSRERFDAIEAKLVSVETKRLHADWIVCNHPYVSEIELAYFANYLKEHVNV